METVTKYWHRKYRPTIQNNFIFTLEFPFKSRIPLSLESLCFPWNIKLYRNYTGNYMVSLCNLSTRWLWTDEPCIWDPEFCPLIDTIHLPTSEWTWNFVSSISFRKLLHISENNKSSISINPTMNDKPPANEFVESIYVQKCVWPGNIICVTAVKSPLTESSVDLIDVKNASSVMSRDM